MDSEMEQLQEMQNSEPEEAGDMAPFELSYQIKQIIADKCQCVTLWRGGDVTREEAEQIHAEIEKLFEEKFGVTA